MSGPELIDRLRLIRSENVGPINYRLLLRRFDSAAAALSALPDLAQRGGRARALRICPRTEAEREIEALAAIGGRLVVEGDPDYPPLLAEVPDGPPIVALLGNAALLRQKSIAIVGARNASANGRKIAEILARDLASAGFAVVSGLARGIDAAAHRGALEGGTTAVVAGGVDIVYPPEHADLQRAIAERGAVLAEQPLGTEPQARHFPRRNRVISGLALGVVVVEAAQRSGSLITARMAGEQGRQVMAVPGSPLDPRCRGTNELIRDNATLVESAEHVIEAVEGMIRPALAEPGWRRRPVPEIGLEMPSETPEDARSEVEMRLGASPVAVDELLRQCQVSPPVLHAVLLELELAGRLERHPGNRISLLPAGPQQVS